MATKVISASKDASALLLYGGGGSSVWSGTDNHLMAGKMGFDIYGGTTDQKHIWRSCVYFPISFTGMKTISSAILKLKANKVAGAYGSTHSEGDSSMKTLGLYRLTTDWAEGIALGEGDFFAQVWNWETISGGVLGGQVSFPTGLVDGVVYDIDVTTIVQAWFAGQPNYGIALINNNEVLSGAALNFFSRSGPYVPNLTLTYTENVAPNAPVSLNPTGDAVVASLRPQLSGTRSDPDAGDSISAVQIFVYADDGTTVLWDSGSHIQTGISFSRTYDGTPLAWATFYKWKARTKDVDGLWGPYSALQRFQTVNGTPPVAVVGLSTTVTETAIVLDWDESLLAVDDFDRYLIYRRIAGDTDWEAHASIFDKTTNTYEDVSVAFNVTYEYAVTQFKNITGGFTIESVLSDIAVATLVGVVLDTWTVLGADGITTFELPVTSAPFKEPVQQEEFEPLGSTRKSIVRGKVIGAEGTLKCKWASDEREVAKANIRYITRNRGPHVLRSPFGDVWLVEFSGPDKDYQPVGHMEVSIAWTEVA